MLRRVVLLAIWCGTILPVMAADSPSPLPGTAPLDWTDDISVRIVDEAHQFLDRKLQESVASRGEHWNRDVSSREAYAASIEPNRDRLREIVGAVDERLPATMERFGDDKNPALVAEASRFKVYQVRWPVLEHVWGEGLLLEPVDGAAASAVAIPDADQTPEQLAGLAAGTASPSQTARRLAELGFRVVVPVLVDRSCTFSGNPKIAMTNQPHREWIYRQAYEMGRHVIGYEIAKVLSAVDWLKQASPQKKVAVFGYGEGGLVALYSAALDTRIDACLTSGYFDSRLRLWEEPIYRNVWSLLREFGDAEIASLVAPRALVVEYSEVPAVDGPPAVEPGRRGGAAPGRLVTPEFAAVQAEFDRAKGFAEPLGQFQLVAGDNGKPLGPGSDEAIGALCRSVGLEVLLAADAGSETVGDRRAAFDPVARQGRQVAGLTTHVQHAMRISDATRDQFFLNRMKLDSAEGFAQQANEYRKTLWRDVIGALDDPLVDPQPRSRKIYDEPNWTGYEVVLEVLPGLHAWGILCLPKDVQRGEQRPVVVCQHGLEGVPSDTIVREGRPFAPYQAFTAQLAERGFITFAPYNLYRGQDRFRLLQRKANPLKMSLFSIITRQHEQIINWLKTLPAVDGTRIGFYGLSYGGKTAMRVPAVLEDYCLSICSGDFNDWIRKNVTVDAGLSYMFTGEWEMPEFNLGRTFNYAEMSYLIFPRPFMVERGHHDGVSVDSWVAYEFAKTRYLYANLGKGDLTDIEFFNGPHAIHGEGSFDFLHQHLCWPVPQPTMTAGPPPSRR